MKKLIFSLTLSLICFFAANAQEYSSAIGLRLGYPSSVSFKHFINEQGAFELIAGTHSQSLYYRWVNLGVLYEHHAPISSVDGLQWYVGGGAGVYFWNYKGAKTNDYNTTSIGIMGTLGLDYKFDEIPLNLSIDWLPTLYLGDVYVNNFGGGYAGLSARYILN